MGASIIQDTRIGIAVTVGAGAAVIHELPDGVTAVGVHCKSNKQQSLVFLSFTRQLSHQVADQLLLSELHSKCCELLRLNLV